MTFVERAAEPSTDESGSVAAKGWGRLPLGPALGPGVGATAAVDVLRDGALPGAALALLVGSLFGPRPALVAFLAALGLARLRVGPIGLALVGAAAALLANETVLRGELLEAVAAPGRAGAYLVQGVLLGTLLAQVLARRRAAEVVRPQPVAAPASRAGTARDLLSTSSDRSRERFRLMIEGIKDYAIFMTDPQGVVVSWGTGAERVLGYARQEALGRHLRFIYTPEEVAAGAPARELEQALETGRFEAEGWRLTRGGRPIWAHVGIAPLSGDDGQLQGFAAVLRDASARKEAEEAVRQARDELEVRVRERTAELAEANDALRMVIAQRERAEEVLQKQTEVLQSVLDSMGDAVVVAGPDGRLVLANPAAHRMFGPDLSVESIEAMTGDPPGPLLRSMRGEEINDVEVPVRRPGVDAPLWALVSGRPLRNERGGTTGGVIVCRDTSERRRVAEQLRAATFVAEEAVRARDRFLAVLSHELRTPLTPVLAVVGERLEDRTLQGEIREDLELIRRSVELEARLIDDLLDLNRMAHSKLSLNREVVDVHALIRQTAEICRLDLEQKSIALSFEPWAPRAWADVDPARLQQVFWNLIKNAVKFTPHGGRIVVRSRNERGADGAERLLVDVTDSGIGMDAEFLPRIFEAFVQVPTQGSRRQGGLGLGLTIGRSIVEAMGGRLVASSPGLDLGSTFTVELEAREVPEARPADGEASAVARPDPGPLRILLVEDDAPALRILSRLLRRLGHDVTPAETVAAALEAARAGRFDLLISDIGLPDGTGWDLMVEIRRRLPMPGIALTGLGMDDDLRRTREAGFARHLTKPVDFATLRGAIQRVAEECGTVEGREGPHLRTTPGPAEPVTRAVGG